MVISTRAVRESVNSKNHLPRGIIPETLNCAIWRQSRENFFSFPWLDWGFLRIQTNRNQGSLLPDYLRVIGRNRNAHEFEMVLIVQPQVPLKILPREIQAKQLPLRAAKGDFFLSH